MRLSKAQEAMIARLREAGQKGERVPFTGGRGAGRVASRAKVQEFLDLDRLKAEGDNR